MSKAANLASTTTKTLAQDALARLGFEHFIGAQERCATALIDGQDVLALLPTGAGKSVIYQMAALARPGVGVVISPLIAIMQQQVSRLREQGIKAEFLNSTQNGAEQNDLHWRLRHGDVEILYMSPEKLLQPSVMGLLEDVPLACIAVDEAHCVLRWGQNFRPEYAQLGQLRQVFANVPVIALTGTLLPDKEASVSDALGLDSPFVVREDVMRDNIRLQVSQKKRAKHQLLAFLLKEVRTQSGIVYCRARNKTAEIAHWLQEQGISAACYHANLSPEQREQAHQRFASGDVQVLVATTAYGMGVDLEHVRFVVHLDLPLSIESYVQEVGRAGRDGRAANALLFYGLQDILQTWQFVQLEQSDEDDFWALIAYLESLECRSKVIGGMFDEMREQGCGQCDRCRRGHNQHNVTVAAQKFLSLVHRTKGRIPFASLIATLLGKRTKNVLEYGLESNALFAQGKGLDEVQWKALVRSLLAKRYLLLHSIMPFSVSLAEKSRRLLRAEEQLLLGADHFYPLLKEPELAQLQAHDWQSLMQWSVTNKVHQFLSETQLHKIYEARPKSLAALSRVTGLSKDLLQTLNAEHLFQEY
ncbi:RecQ family ATP-dependent DNA helicase [Marinomonas ostreistagni]|uniref:RecQ family ATP-dependent DNA helicase n=1 Tax=Marinomonas ostreistagni TaxID=359209 RepID=UPI00194F6B1E|nr:ATP-dependent DNA helicase RecQ [Marinomonas ostreistagni]MBM6549920.1 RecQ family ATP-dependent DNA helicase [Marinomonas ostreistagni]